jgi:hypothetical protein
MAAYTAESKDLAIAKDRGVSWTPGSPIEPNYIVIAKGTYPNWRGIFYEGISETTSFPECFEVKEAYMVEEIFLTH